MSTSPTASTAEFRPRHRLFVVFDSPETAREARGALLSKRLATDDTWVFAGEPGAARLDLSGNRHGVWGRMIRTLQHVMSADYDYLDGLKRAVGRGHVVLAVHAVDLDAAYALARFLRNAGGRDFAYFAEWDFEPVAA